MAYQLKKWVWTEADFDQMGWHDATIYAMQFGKDIGFDIDYIFEWVRADKDDFFSFIIAPATLIFCEPTDVVFDLNFRFGVAIEIEELHRRTITTGATQWHLETQQGDITIMAESFRQVVRRPPTRQTGQQIISDERGATSFSQIPETDFVLSEEIKRLKATDLTLRQKATDVRRLRRQLEMLGEQRSAGLLEVKKYMLEKRRVEAKIRQLTDELQAIKWENIM